MFLDAIKDKDKDKMEEIKLMFVDMGHSEHMTHCFDYLRQTIACAGDMALEWPRTEPTGERVAVDGWGIPHECKSWVSTYISVHLIADCCGPLLTMGLVAYFGLYG